MEKEIFKKQLGGLMKPPLPKSNVEKNEEESFPVSWAQYFDKMLDFKLTQQKFSDQSSIINTFRVYIAGNKSEPVFLFLHGGGHSALSWALTVNEMKDEGMLVCYDCRGHGNTFTDEDELLSQERLTRDCIDLVNQLLKDSKHLILVGHSMGGAIASHAAASGEIKNLVGLVVIDVVEGTALAALPFMHQVLESRPQFFDSIESAIKWSISSGTLKKLESAKVSIPSQLILKDGKYVWRTDLFKSEIYWKGWFTNLSKIFLSVKAVKLLLLAGTDRLDTDLTVAQMQGKYQLVLLPCGHVIQEDEPKQTSSALIKFKQRYKF